MIITAKSRGKGSSGKNPTSGNQLQAGQQVNRVGKYLYKHLDGAYKIKNSPNTCDVYVTVLYQIPPEFLKKYGIKGDEYEKVNEMTVNLSITTYQNKVRINIIEVTPDEKTIGFDVYKPEQLENLQESAAMIFNKVCKRISKEFQDYEFLF